MTEHTSLLQQLIMLATPLHIYLPRTCPLKCLGLRRCLAAVDLLRSCWIRAAIGICLARCFSRSLLLPVFCFLRDERDPNSSLPSRPSMTLAIRPALSRARFLRPGRFGLGWMRAFVEGWVGGRGEANLAGVSVVRGRGLWPGEKEGCEVVVRISYHPHSVDVLCFQGCCPRHCPLT
jgi:hypothetical protein